MKQPSTVPGRGVLRRSLALAVATALVVASGATRAGDKGWKATYTGDFNGSVSGRIVVPGGTSMVAIVKGASMAPDYKSKGTAALDVKVMTLPDQEPGLRQLDITLDDGTVCRLQPDGSETVTLHDTSKKNYHVSMSGKLSCDGGKTIRVEAWAKN